MLGSKKGKLRYQDVEKEIPPRVRKEPKPGDNPLKRPYPPHRRDIRIVDALLQNVPKQIPTQFCERDMRTATRPQGVLYFHMLDIQSVKLSRKDFIPGASLCIYVEYECQGVIKCSYPVRTLSTSKIRIDHHAHFSAEISESRNDETNDFVLHVYAFQDPEKHWLIGSQLLHMFDFVRDIHGITTKRIQDDLSYYVGLVTFEFAWAYGSFGYGYSNQLLNTKNPVYESVCHSMFPRISPSIDDLIDNKFRVRVPKRLRLVNLHSLLVRVPIQGKSTRIIKRKTKLGKITTVPLTKRDFNKEAKTVVFRRVKFSRGRPVHAALNLDIHQKFMENDFNQSYGEFICLRNRRERLIHLTRMVEGRLRDRIENDATGLFYPIKEARDCRIGLELKKPLACPPGYLEHRLHPKSCPAKQSVKLTKKDEEFISKITSAPRFSGYLAHVFGYSNVKGYNEKPKETCEFKVAPYAFLDAGLNDKESMTLFQKIAFNSRRAWYNFLLGFFAAWEFIFPSPNSKNDILIPEISVTLPSPADSTTEFYSHCVQDKVYPTPAELTQARRQALQLVRAARKKAIYDDDDDDDQWLTEPDEVPVGERGKTAKRIRDIRPMEHVEKEKF